MDGSFWHEAEADFREALQKRNKDQKDALTYGWHLVDYFPHRELGIALMNQKRYLEAIKELETSLSTETSAKAEFYLDKVRRLWIEQENSDISPPGISIESPTDNKLTNDFFVTVRGVANDDTFIKEILVNYKPIRIDLAKHKIPFDAKVPVKRGENLIIIEAEDITGKTVRKEKKVFCDRTSPILNIDELRTRNNNSKNSYVLRGYAHDDSGIKEIRVNGRKILAQPVSEILLNHTVFLLPNQEKVEVIACDQAGNRTYAEILPEKGKHSRKTEGFKPALLVSRDLFYMNLPRFHSKNSIIQPYDMTNEKTSDYYALTTPRGNMNKKKKNNKHKMLGNYYALIVGINKYDEWKPLKTAVNDASELKDVLVSRYNFPGENIIFRADKDATRNNIIQDMQYLAGGLRETDNLLIYFAGHGELDKTTSDGYWIPADAKKREPCTWITNSVIRKILCSEHLKGKNILVIADTCYSGTLLRERELPRWINRKIKPGNPGINPRGGESSDPVLNRNYQEKIFRLGLKKSRQVISSGGIEQVDDKGVEGHSLFAYHLLKALKENTQRLIDIKMLFYSRVWLPVASDGGQRPDIRPYDTEMHEDGQFVLVLKPELAETQSVDKGKTTGLPEYRNIFSDRNVNLPDTTHPVIEVRGWNDRRPVFADCAFLEMNFQDDSGIQYVKINEQKIMKRPGRKLYFNHLVPLKQGDNTILIECADQVGNKAQKKLLIRRNLQEIYKIGSRMSAALFPFSLEGSLNVSIEDILSGCLMDSKRFNMRKRFFLKKGRLSKGKANDLDEAIQMARDKGIDFALAGNAVAKNRTLQVSIYLVETGTLHHVTEQDVYGENIDIKQIRDLCRGLVLKLCEALPVVEGRIIKIKHKEIIVNRGEVNHIKKGMHLAFFQDQEPVRDIDTGELLGMDVDLLGSGRIERPLEKMAYTELLDKDNITKLRVGQKMITK